MRARSHPGQTSKRLALLSTLRPLPRSAGNPRRPSAFKIACRNCGCLNRREIRASALRCRPRSCPARTERRRVGRLSVDRGEVHSGASAAEAAKAREAQGACHGESPHPRRSGGAELLPLEQRVGELLRGKRRISRAARRTAPRAHPPCPTRQGRGRPGPRAGTRDAHRNRAYFTSRPLAAEDAFAAGAISPKLPSLRR